MNDNERKGRTTPNLIPVTEWSQHHEWPPLGGLRHLIFHANENGFDKVVRRVGRRVLLDEDAFFKWVDEQQEVSISGVR